MSNQPESETETLDFEIFPNPAQDLLHIKSPAEIKRVEISTLSGQLILSREYQNTKVTRLNIENFTPGIYLVKTIGVDKTQQTKVMVQ